MNRREAIAALTSLPALKSLSVASLQPKDVIVAECEGPLRAETADYIRHYLSQIWPDNQIVVLEGGIRLKVMKG